MKYQEVIPINRDQALLIFQEGAENEICEALIQLAFYDPDLEWVQKQCLHYLDDQRGDVRSTALLCIGHLARIHGRLDIDKVLPIVYKLTKDPEIGGRAEDALDDIQVFIGIPETLRI